MGEARRLAERHFAAIGQSLFASSGRVGLLAVLALAALSPILAASGLVASLAARVSASRLQAPRTLLDTGIVEMNGWFLGLALGAFLAPGAGLLVALMVAGPAVAASVVIMHRLTSTWDLPLMVGPYLPAFWLMWLGLSMLPWVGVAPSVALPLPDGTPAMLLVAGLRGVGEIFFLPDARFGAALIAVLATHDRRAAAMLWLGSLGGVAIGYGLGAPLWQTEIGLHAFTPALVGLAALKRFRGLGLPAFGCAVALAPLLTLACLKVAEGLNIFALSAPYLVFVWGAILASPVRRAEGGPSLWTPIQIP